MLTFLINKEVSKLLVSLLINISSAYFFAAALTPTGVKGDFNTMIINFSFNLFAATMYFILAIKINHIYE